MNRLSDADVAAFFADLDSLPTTSEPQPRPAPAGTVTGRPVAQGDLLFLPADERAPHWAQPIVAPVPLVREGNGHRVVPDGPVRYAPVTGDRHVIALLVVEPGGSARVEQPRGADAHDALVLGPGTWQVRRQAEQVAPNVIRRVVD